MEKQEKNIVLEVVVGKDRSGGVNKMGGLEFMNFIIRSDAMTSQIRQGEESILLKDGNAGGGSEVRICGDTC